MNEYNKKNEIASVAYLKIDIEKKTCRKWFVQYDFADSAESMSEELSIPMEEYIKVMRDKYGATIMKNNLTCVFFEEKEEAEKALVWVESMVVVARLRRSK
jgi:hypothetical protein